MKLSLNVKEYKLKFYLNAKHYIILNDKRGETHPHTWEIQLHFALPRTVFVEFSTIEKAVNQYLKKYQNQVLNEVAPFDTIIPTLENMTDSFAESFSSIIDELGGTLYSVETAETPTRTYVVSLNRKQTDEMPTVNQIVDRIVADHEKED